MNIYVLSTVNVGIDIVDSIKEKVKIKGIIGLSEREATDDISGYVFMESFSKQNNFQFIPVSNYSLKDPEDKKQLLSLNIDILLVLGWQRLIPQWLIEHCNVTTIGAHGSPFGIVEGRGRSPQNWSLILDKHKFEISIFHIDSGIDSGNIIDTSNFIINDFDDISTLYCKSGILTAKMIIKNIQNEKIQRNKSTPQNGNEFYLPQRLPQDGEIDWNRTTKNLYNFIRALTHPYPGSFCTIESSKLYIWSAIPFEDESSYSPGTILKKFDNGKFLIKTLDGALLVDNYSIFPKQTKISLKEGDMLPSTNFKSQIKRIIERHYSKYPQNKLHPEILNLQN